MNNLSTQIATTREQSEQLLAMGVKSETADMYGSFDGNPYYISYTPKFKGFHTKIGEDDYLAWSLSRLISMMPSEITVDRKVGSLFISHIDISYFGFEPDKSISFLIGFAQGPDESLFDICIDMIDWLIKNNHFNEEYLKGGKP